MEHSLQESEIGQIKKYEICNKFTRLRCFPGIFFSIQDIESTYQNIRKHLFNAPNRECRIVKMRSAEL